MGGADKLREIAMNLEKYDYYLYCRFRLTEILSRQNESQVSKTVEREMRNVEARLQQRINTAIAESHDEMKTLNEVMLANERSL